MWTSTLSIDKDIRDMASKRAKADKISVSAVARLLLKDYAEWRISIWSRVISWNINSNVIEVDIDTQKKMDSISALWNNKK